MKKGFKGKPLQNQQPSVAELGQGELLTSFL